MKKRNWFILLAISAIFLLLLCSFWQGKSSVRNTYEAALQRIEVGEYAEAEKMLNSIYSRDYQDTRALLSFCEAYQTERAGDLEGAYYKVKNLRLEYLPTEQAEELKEFQKSVVQRYNAYLAEEREKANQRREQQIQNGVPFVGLEESRIGDTSLGAPAEEVRHNWATHNGERCLANLYDFYKDGAWIFSARCVGGKVVQVWDYRDKPVSNREPYQPDHSDPYNASDYRNAEDFYDDNLDNFIDYYAAEAYYNKHNK